MQEITDRQEKIHIYREIIIKAQKDEKFRATFDYDQFCQDIKSIGTLSTTEKSGSGLNIAIIGYASDMVGNWDPFDTANGLPGSEECVVYASEELANRGYNVTLYMNPLENSIWKSPFSNPRWLHEKEWDSQSNQDEYDLVLMWRRYDIDYGRKRGKVVFFWPHDSPPQGSYGSFPKFDGICVLSSHQRKQLSVFKGFEDIPYVVCGNGIVLNQFKDLIPRENKYSIGYFSNYSRGLYILLLLWPEIKREFPESTLSICYGRQTWNTLSENDLKQLVLLIEQYKKQGVIEYGKVGHSTLAEIMKQTSVWAYPCNTETETFCITAIKCQAAGCIPVTTRIGALEETIHQDAPNIKIIQTYDDVAAYKKLLLNTLYRIRDCSLKDINLERIKYMKFAQNFSWEICIDKWLALYNAVKEK